MPFIVFQSIIIMLNIRLFRILTIEIIFLLLLSQMNLLSQELYYSNWSNRSIGKTNLNTCISEDICVLPDRVFGITDIAIHPNGEIYIINSIQELYKVEVADCNVELVTILDSNSNLTGLVIDKDGRIWAAGRELVFIDLITGEYRILGTFPNVSCSGDMAFYNGKLIMSAFIVNTGIHGIYEVDMEEPQNTQLIKSLMMDDIRNVFHGLVVFGEPCQHSTLYGTGLKQNTISSEVIEGGIFGFTFNEDEISLICSTAYFSGATHPLEFLGSETNCELLFDLDRDNSSGEYPYDYRNTSIACADTKVAAICDDDVVIFTSDARVDSIVLILEGVRNPGSESLRLTDGYTAAALISTGTQAMPAYALFMQGESTDEEVMEALRNVFYHHSSAQALPGIRTVLVEAFNAVRSSEARAYIHVESTPNSGRDTTFVLCSHIQFVNFSTIIGGDPGGRWEPPFVSGEDIYFSEADVLTTYLYITESGECSDTATVEFIRVVDRSLDLGGDGEICRGESIILSLPSIEGDTLLWDDGSVQSERTIMGPGTYSVTLTTVEGCEYIRSVTYTPRFIDSTLTVQVCHGERYAYGGAEYDIGQWIQDTLTGTGICDTVINILVSSFPIPTLDNDTMVCFNGAILFEGVEYFPGDTLMRWKTSMEGCDTLIRTLYLEHEIDSLRVGVEEELLCPGHTTSVEVYPMEGLSWSDGGSDAHRELAPGHYTVTYTDASGCAQEVEFMIEEAVLPDYALEWMDPQCLQGNGYIGVSIEGGMMEGLTIEINGQRVEGGSLIDLGEGTYSIRIVDHLGCVQEDAVVLVDTLNLEVLMAGEVEVIAGNRVNVEFEATGTEVAMVTHTPEEGLVRMGNSLQITGIRDREYILLFISEEGCTEELTLQVRVLIPDEIITLPNIVSRHPHDEENGKVYLKVESMRYDMMIYDRWGNAIYDRRNLTGGDDSVAWIPAQSQVVSGVYVYMLRAYTESGEVVKTGTVTVVE